MKILLIGFKLDHGRVNECSVNLALGFKKIGHDVQHVSPEEILHGMDYHKVNMHRAWKLPIKLSTILKQVPKPDLVFIVQNYLHFHDDQQQVPVAYFHNEDYCGPGILNAKVNFYCQPPYKEFWRTYYPWSYANAPLYLSLPAVHAELFTPDKKTYFGLTYLTDCAVEENREERDWIWNEMYRDKEYFHVQKHLYDHYVGGAIGARSSHEPRENWSLPHDKYCNIMARCERVAFIPVRHVPYSRRLIEHAACNTKVTIFCRERDIDHYVYLYGDINVHPHENGYYKINIDKGRDWVLANHTYEHRCNAIINQLKKHVSI